jgi:hypothetical protein
MSIVSHFEVDAWWRELVLLTFSSLLSLVFVLIGSSWASFTVAGMSVLQLFYYLGITVRRINRHLQHADKSLQYCLGLLGLMVATFIISYGVNFFLLTLADANALRNVNPPNIWYRLFDGIYFSTVTFTATGFGEISPATYPAKVVVWGEMVLGFTTSVFAISSFISLANRNS